MAKLRSRKFSIAPVLWIASSFALGIWISAFVLVSSWLALGMAAVLGLFSYIARRHRSATWLILAAFMMTGAAAASFQTASISPDRIRSLYDSGRLASGSAVEVEGLLVREPEAGLDSSSIVVSVQRLTSNDTIFGTKGNVRLYVRGNAADGLHYGSRVRASTQLLREESFLNPGVTARRDLLDRSGIDAVGSVSDARRIEILGEGRPYHPLRLIYAWRARMITEMRDNLEPRTAGVMIASLLGNKNFLDRETAEAFREGGTFHILVISGLHITFIGGVILVVMRRFTPDRRIQFVVSTLILWGYTLAVGAEVPVVRAAAMFSLMLGGYVLNRRSSLLNSLCFSALVLLALRPSELLDASFQLTFASVAAIVCIAYPVATGIRAIGAWEPSRETPFPPNVPSWLRTLCELVYWQPDQWKLDAPKLLWTAGLEKSPSASKLDSVSRVAVRYLTEGVLVSVIVQVVMLPLSIIYFHRVSVASVLLNLWVGTLIALESFAAVIAVAAGIVSEPIAAGFYRLTEVLNSAMLALPSVFADDPAWSFRVPAYSGAGRVWYILFFFLIGIAAIMLNRWDPFAVRRRGRLAAVVLSVVLAAVTTVMLAHPLSSPRPDGRLRVDFLDVGQGDSALITFPNGRTMLLDGGGRMRYDDPYSTSTVEPDVPRIGEMVVSEFLWHRGYSQIDFILATHEDLDHIQGLSDVVRNFNVSTALIARGANSDADALKELVTAATKRSTAVRTLSHGDSLQFGEVRIDVLNPPAATDALSDNDRSLVLRIRYGSRTILMTGDIERAAEETMLDAGEDLRADVVKVPHHGSRTSSTAAFVNAVSADLAVISVGRRSQFGHPRAEVVERWLLSGAEVMTTGARGTITMTTDGRDLSVSTFLP